MTSHISLDLPSGAWLADRALWLAETAPDNSEQQARLRRNLRRARQEVLTPRQQEVVELYYDRGLTMGQIALRLNIHRSTVSRTLSRAKKRLYQSLRYTL